MSRCRPPRLDGSELLALAIVVGIGVSSSMVFTVALGYPDALGIVVGASYGLLLSLALGGVTLFVLRGPMRGWLASLSFAADVAVRSVIYAAIIIPTDFFQLGALVVGLHRPPSTRDFWLSVVFSAVSVTVRPCPFSLDRDQVTLPSHMRQCANM